MGTPRAPCESKENCYTDRFPPADGKSNSRSPPDRHASLAQLAEQLTLNQRVVGSSPTGGTFPKSCRILTLDYLPVVGGAAQILRRGSTWYCRFSDEVLPCRPKSLRILSNRHDKPKGPTVVWIDGRGVYLGK